MMKMLAIPRPNARPLVCLIATGALLGISANLAKLAGATGTNVLAYLFWSVAAAGLILLALATARGARPSLKGQSLIYYATSALLTVAASSLLLYSAIPHVGVSYVVLTMSLPPMLTYIGAVIIGVERFHPLRALGVVAAMSGAAALAISNLNGSPAHPAWLLFVLAAPIVLAAGNLYRTRAWPSGMKDSELAPGMLLAAALLLLPATALPTMTLHVSLNAPGPVLVIGAQAVIYAAQYRMLFTLQRIGGPVMLSLIGSIGAIAAVPIAIFLQGEPPPRGLMLGCFLIGLGVLGVNFGRAASAPSITKVGEKTCAY